MTPLSSREIEVLQLLSQGLNSTDIGKSLFLSSETIRSHKKNIYSKLGINNAIQLGMWIERHLIVNELKIA